MDFAKQEEHDAAAEPPPFEQSTSGFSFGGTSSAGSAGDMDTPVLPDDIELKIKARGEELDLGSDTIPVFDQFKRLYSEYPSTVVDMAKDVKNGGLPQSCEFKTKTNTRRICREVSIVSDFKETIIQREKSNAEIDTEIAACEKELEALKADKIRGLKAIKELESEANSYAPTIQDFSDRILVANFLFENSHPLGKAKVEDLRTFLQIETLEQVNAKSGRSLSSVLHLLKVFGWGKSVNMVQFFDGEMSTGGRNPTKDGLAALLANYLFLRTKEEMEVAGMEQPCRGGSKQEGREIQGYLAAIEEIVGEDEEDNEEDAEEKKDIKRKLKAVAEYARKKRRLS